MELQSKDTKPDRPPSGDVAWPVDGTPAGSGPGLAYWQAAVDGKLKVDPVDVALMAAHPSFADACRTAQRSAIVRDGRNKLQSRVTRDISRLFYGYLVIYLDASGGITLTAIRELCREIGLASPGRAQAILFHL
jgi:hypothetical protein